jgi:nitrite reductase (NO-forming)
MAAGGTAWVGAMAILAWMLWTSWRVAVNRRHALPMAAYGAAVAFAILGGTLGALMGSGVATGEWYVHFKRAHMTVNVLGFASLTVVGTLVTLLPTALRVRMPPWRGQIALALFAGGLLLQLVGWDLDSAVVLGAGGAAYAAGAMGLAWLVVSVLRVERQWKIPVAAMHMMSAAAWFVFGSVALSFALAHGPSGFDAFRPVFLVTFVGGWLVQVLLGAWSYLLPMSRPGHPDARRRSLAAFEIAAFAQVILLNAGLVLMAGRGAGWASEAVGDAGIVLTFVGAGLALTKAWVFQWLRYGPVETERAKAVWGG